MVRSDYLVKGCGVTSMGFVDTLLRESDATVTIVDRRAAPGGHWNDAYPFVRLHQPAPFYGLASSPIGDDRIDTGGVNAGLARLPSGLQVADYYHRAMTEVFLPTGRVRYFPMSEIGDDGEIVSLISGRRARVAADRFVDGTHLETVIPLTHRRSFEVEAGVDCIAPNELARRARGQARFTVIGGGKTGLDCISWLLDQGAESGSISWVLSRDAWWSNRRAHQTSAAFRSGTLELMCRQSEALASAASVDEVGEGMEAAGAWMRLDTSVKPTMFHAATVTAAELERARHLGALIREGRVLRIEPGRMILQGGNVPTRPGTLFIDCSATALPVRTFERESVFGDNRIDLHFLRFPMLCLSVALTAFIEARVSDEASRRAMTRVVPVIDTVEDWIDRFLLNAANQRAWSADPRVSAWLAECRLDPVASMMRSIPSDDHEASGLRDRVRALSGPVLANLGRLRESAQAS
jgi:hypothetical protein